MIIYNDIRFSTQSLKVGSLRDSEENYDNDSFPDSAKNRTNAKYFTLQNNHSYRASTQFHPLTSKKIFFKFRYRYRFHK